MDGNDISEQIYYSVHRSVHRSVCRSVNNSVDYSVWRLLTNSVSELVNKTIEGYEWN